MTPKQQLILIGSIILPAGVTHTDFFATRPTDYSKAGEGEDYENIW
jgi:ribonucleotide reductase beta subunit family protein with ferritin-like domain